MTESGVSSDDRPVVNGHQDTVCGTAFFGGQRGGGLCPASTEDPRGLEGPR